MRIFRQFTRSFQWGWNVADRLAFAELLASDQPLTASMDDVYSIFDINPKEITTLESYLQEYYSRIMKKLKEIEYEQAKLGKTTSKNKPFFF